jgi:endonuclease-3
MPDASETNHDSGLIREILAATYPNATIALKYGTPWELLVAVMLSAQCTDTMVNHVTDRLFGKYPTIASYANALQTEFEADIKSTGFFHMKAKHIQETARILISRHGGAVPRTMEQLTELPGVARKTANIVLSNAFSVVVGIAVDTHVARISQRLRLVPLSGIRGKNPVMAASLYGNRIDYYKSTDTDAVERSLMETVPKSDWNRITYRIIDHGRARCTAARPKCTDCPLRQMCPVARA